MPLSESEIACRYVNGPTVPYVHAQLIRIILTSREQPLRIEREVSSWSSEYLYKCC